MSESSQSEIITAETTARKAPRVSKAERSESGVVMIQVESGQVAGIDSAFGTTSSDFQSYAQLQLLNILRAGQSGDDFTLDLNAALAMLSAIDPQDEMEAMLAAQMVATHHLCMRQMNKHAY